MRGETLEASKPTIDDLARYGIGTVLDYSVEAASTEESFEHTKEELLRGIELGSQNPHIAFCVFKVSGLAPRNILEKQTAGVGLTEGEKLVWEGIQRRVHRICESAHRVDVRVFIDAEESWIQGAVDELAEAMMEKFNKEKPLIYHTIQMYRTDRMGYLQNLSGKAATARYYIGLKVVRGAYMERERERAETTGNASPVFATKQETDEAYDEALEFCIERLERISICAGTHNEHSTLLATQLMAQQEFKPKDPRVYFSQLYGMGDHLSYNLANEQYLVAKYVPYGPVRAVIPYLFRRAEENTSIQGQSSRELGLIREEIQRRKKTRAPKNAASFSQSAH